MQLDNFLYAYVYAVMQVCVDIPLSFLCVAVLNSSVVISAMFIADSWNCRVASRDLQVAMNNLTFNGTDVRLFCSHLLHIPDLVCPKCSFVNTRVLYDRVLRLNVERIYGRFNLSIWLFFSTSTASR